MKEHVVTQSSICSSRTVSQQTFPEFNPTVLTDSESGSHSSQKQFEIQEFINTVNTEIVRIYFASSVVLPIDFLKEQLYWEQKNLSIPPPKDEYEKLNMIQTNLIQQTKTYQQRLRELLNEDLLTPTQLHRHSSMQQEIFTILTKLQLFQEELFFMTTNEALHSTRW